MVIREFIVHLIEKQVDSSASSLSLSNESISSSSGLERFLDDLNKAYNSKSNKVFGSFLAAIHADDGKKNAIEELDDSVDNMETLLKAYLQKQTNFVEYSHQAMALLKYYIEQASKATGGYVIFINYTLFGSDFILIAMLNNAPGISVDSSLEINNVDYLDISKLHLAARIDLTQWQEESESGRYISMIRARESHKLSEYFRKFIGSDETIDSKHETSELLTAVNQFCDNNIVDDEKKSNFKHKAAEYCIEQADKGQNVVLKDFSNYAAEGAVDDFMNYVNSQQFDLKREISPNKAIIRRFNKLSGRNARVSITIDEEALGDSVIFDADKETLTISDLPATLKAQLLNR